MNVNKADINNEINKQKSHAYKDSITSANEETCRKSLMIQREQYEVVNHRRINNQMSNMNGQKKKYKRQLSATQYTENYSLGNIN